MQTDPPAAFLSRVHAARLLGRSISRIRQWEKAGRLHGVKTEGGVTQFARSELLELRKTLGMTAAQSADVDVTGAVCAEVFRMFYASASIHEVVIKTQLRPEQVRRLYAQYQTPLGSEVRASPLPPLDDFDQRAKDIDDEVRNRRAKRR
jgi:hypothetical protein